VTVDHRAPVSAKARGVRNWLAMLADKGDSSIVPPAPWRIITSLALSVAALGVSVYLTVDHFAKIAPACSDSGIVNCTKVTTSAQSYFLGIPVAVLGLCFYVVMVVMNLPPLWRSSDRRVHIARFGLIAVGMAFALYLVSAELLIIGNICLWCTSVHVITFLLFVLIVSTVPSMLGWGAHSTTSDGTWKAGDTWDEAASDPDSEPAADL
jgi:uncharacterized membrane protein